MPWCDQSADGMIVGDGYRGRATAVRSVAAEPAGPCPADSDGSRRGDSGRRSRPGDKSATCDVSEPTHQWCQLLTSELVDQRPTRYTGCCSLFAECGAKRAREVAASVV